MTPFNPGEAAEFVGPHTAKRVMSLLFHDGMPTEEGWYLVELEESAPQHPTNLKFDVTRCRAIAVAPGGVGYEWVGLAPRHIKRWAKLPS